MVLFCYVYLVTEADSSAVTISIGDQMNVSCAEIFGEQYN